MYMILKQENKKAEKESKKRKKTQKNAGFWNEPSSACGCALKMSREVRPPIEYTQSSSAFRARSRVR
jgi:hypothetical protein